MELNRTQQLVKFIFWVLGCSGILKGEGRVVGGMVVGGMALIVQPNNKHYVWLKLRVGNDDDWRFHGICGYTSTLL